MHPVAAAKRTELLNFQPFRGILFILFRSVIAPFAIHASQQNV
jgi:hypothetical protein